ncbi:MAG: RNA polymerase sigma factor [Armatimonadota bacterium]
MNTEPQESFDEAIRASFRRVARGVARLACVTGPEDAEDVTLEAFTRYLARRQERHHDGTPVPTVHEVVAAVMEHAQDFAKNRGRREARRRRLAHLIGDRGRSARAADPSFDQAYAAAVWEAVSELPAELREVMRARSNGSSYADIAETLGLAEGTVKSRLHRARALLRQRLAEEVGEVQI